MSTRSRQEYFAVLRERYRKSASKTEQTHIVNEAVQNTELHRKSVLRALNSGTGLTLDGEIPRLGRPRKFSTECFEALKKLYRASEYQCADKLKYMIPALLRDGSFGFSESVELELLAMSHASIDRYLGPYRSIERRRKNSGTRPGSKLFKKMIPLKSLTLISPRCGYLEADTVAHCGGDMAGEFVWSLTVTDCYSGWTENRAFYGKTAKNVQPALQSIHESMPFGVVAINVDNGSEFLNDRVVQYYHALGELKVIPFPLTRSRAYHSNDNARVEQKNWTHVRQLFGYDRFEFKDLVPVMDEIYRVQNTLSNFYVPQFKLKSKVRLGAKVQKKYFAPLTPYERVLQDPRVGDDMKLGLREQYALLNYFELRRRKEVLLADFIQLHRRLRSENQALPQGSLLTASR